MSIQNPGRFGLKTFLIGLAIGVTAGIGLVASAICPPILVIPAVLIFVFANSPLFAWAGAHAAVAVIAAAGALAGLVTTFAVQTLDVLASVTWRVGSWLASACIPKKKSQEVESQLASHQRMNEYGLGPDSEKSDLDESPLQDDGVVTSLFGKKNMGRRGDLAGSQTPGNSDYSAAAKLGH